MTGLAYMLTENLIILSWFGSALTFSFYYSFYFYRWQMQRRIEVVEAVRYLVVAPMMSLTISLLLTAGAANQGRLPNSRPVAIFVVAAILIGYVAARKGARK